MSFGDCSFIGGYQENIESSQNAPPEKVNADPHEQETRESPLNYQFWAEHRRGSDPGPASSPQHEGGVQRGQPGYDRTLGAPACRVKMTD